MKHIRVTVECIGDPITSLGDTQKIAKVLDTDINLVFNGFSVTVRTDSNILDLIAIHKLSKYRNTIKQWIE